MDVPSNDTIPTQETEQPFQPVAPIVPPQTVQPEMIVQKKSNKTAYKVLSIVALIFFLVVGFFGGFMISFGSCFKSNCSPVASGAPIWIPLATLTITIPLVVKAFKKK